MQIKSGIGALRKMALNMSDSPMLPVRKLAASELCRACDEKNLPFRTTDELEDLAQVLGQGRAVDAIRFSVGMARDGYNLFAMGPEGIGRHTIVRRHLEEQAPRRETPPDWCYVFNFETPHKPRAIQLPAGKALKFRDDMERLVEDLRSAIPAAFESDEYRARQKEIATEFTERQEQGRSTASCRRRNRNGWSR